MDDQELRRMIEAYQPNSEVLESMTHIKMLATVGPSASGKSTIMKALAADNPDFYLVVGQTSRQPRPGEVDGQDLRFRTKADILQDIKSGSLNQVVIGPSGDLYCTGADDFKPGKVCLFPLIPQGVRQFRALPLKFFAAAFIVPANFELWRQWLNQQAELSNWTPQQLAGRLAEAKTSHEFALSDNKIRFVLNDEVNKAAQRLAQVAHGQVPDDEMLARQMAEANYQKLAEL